MQDLGEGGGDGKGASLIARWFFNHKKNSRVACIHSKYWNTEPLIFCKELQGSGLALAGSAATAYVACPAPGRALARYIFIGPAPGGAFALADIHGPGPGRAFSPAKL